MLMTRQWLLMIAVSAPVLFAPTASLADIMPIGPFVGSSSENFDNTGVDGATPSLTVFGGFATILNTTAGGSIKVERSSSLGGLLQVPRSPDWMVGQLGIAQWMFTTPLSDFGGYFANNSRFNDATIDFFDTSDALLGSLTVTVPNTPVTWTWNGWHSDTPIGSLKITGNDTVFLSGFIWYDDFELRTSAAVPEPGSLKLLTAAGIACAPWVWRQRLIRKRRAASEEAWDRR
jgi:hypothetical protein